MLLQLLLIATALLDLADASPREAELQPRQDVWPYTPFKTSGRDIIDTRGHKVVYAGINWPGAADVMIPEGLQYQSISTIVTKIKDLGMNVIRLTYAIEMIDDILNSTADSTLSGALTKALGPENATIILKQILTNNPDLSAETTRLQVFDAIAAECAKEEIYVHLDNHMSKGTSAPSVTQSSVPNLPSFQVNGAAPPPTETPGSETTTSTQHAGSGA